MCDGYMVPNWQRRLLDFNKESNGSIVFIFLFIILGVLFGFMLGVFPLHVPDAARYAEIPREMLATGDFITPRLNYLKYFEKPPLFYWIQVISLKAFGINIFAANLANALMALFCCFAVYFTGNQLYERRSGLLAAVILATSVLFFAMGRFTTLDLAFTFFLSSALFFFILGNNSLAISAPALTSSNKSLFSKSDWYMWLMYVNVGLAVMTKGLIGIIFPGVIIFLWIIIFHEWRNIKSYRPLSGLVLVLLIAAPWHVALYLRHPEFPYFYFIEQHFLRYFTVYAGRVQPWWFFSVVLIGGFYPWIMFFGQAITFHLRQCREGQSSLLPQEQRLQSTQQHRKNAIFFLLWAVLIYVFFAFSNSRLIPYMLPIFPPMAMLVGNYFAAQWEQKNNPSLGLGFYVLALTNVVLGIGLLLLYFVGGYAPVKMPSATMPINIVVVALVIGGGILSAVSYYRYGVARGFIVQGSVMFLLLLSSVPLIGYIVAQKTTLPFATFIKARLQPQDEVASFHNYYQDLPYYLERRVTVVDYRGELEFGMTHQPQQDWIIDQNMLWQRWRGAARIYMVMDQEDYAKLTATVLANKKNIYLLTSYRDKVLVTNHPLAVRSERRAPGLHSAKT